MPRVSSKSGSGPSSSIAASISFFASAVDPGFARWKARLLEMIAFFGASMSDRVSSYR
jgi:hypothetical protein